MAVQKHLPVDTDGTQIEYACCTHHHVQGDKDVTVDCAEPPLSHHLGGQTWTTKHSANCRTIHLNANLQFAYKSAIVSHLTEALWQALHISNIFRLYISVIKPQPPVFLVCKSAEVDLQQLQPL